MSPVAIIGGSGLYAIDGFDQIETLDASTCWGMPSSPVVRGMIEGVELLFLARHGIPHCIPPHKINYRANIQSLYNAGARSIVAVNAVGGIHAKMGPEVLVVPDQIIDYSWGREHTFFADGLDEVVHVDFSYPYSDDLRKQLISAANRISVDLIDFGVYGCTQGPRLESSAEVSRMERDGVDVIGMTAMPEAGLARELGMEYATLALVVNWAAGRTDSLITLEEIHKVIDSGMLNVIKILRETFNPSC